jgi:hypothetical protein
MEPIRNDWYPLLKEEKKGLSTLNNKWRILEKTPPKSVGGNSSNDY